MKNVQLNILISFIISLCTISLKAQSVALPATKACEAVSNEIVSTLMNVELNALIQEDLSFGKRRSICYYYTSDGNRKFFIRISSKSESAQSKKVLENQYENLQNNGDDTIQSYQQISETADTEVLYGTAQDREGKHIHVLSKRYSNLGELQVELTLETKNENASNELLKIIGHIENNQ